MHRFVATATLARASCVFCLLVACTSEPSETGADPSSSSAATGGSGGVGAAGGGGGGEPVCGSGNRVLDETDLIELKHDDGEANSNLRQQSWSITASKKWVLNEEVVNEAARFDLQHPAKIHGFKIMWAELPAGLDPKAELAAGLYGDFGHNGFDFWAPEPLWEGTRCAEDVQPDGAWLSYTFDQPVEVTEPGLIYVAHKAAPTDPVWWFDTDAPIEGDACDTFDECSASYNLPEADEPWHYNGLTFPFQHPFMVRLLVSYTDDVKPADTIFQEVAGAPSGGHISWADYDKDGYDDLLVGNKLWRNEGDGSFSDVSVATGLDGISATGGVWGDYDNDGCLDVFLFIESNNQPDHLMRSDCKGSFVDVTAMAGIVDQQSYENCGDPNNTTSPSAAASWIDIDADGFLDLYVNNFICWSSGNNYIDTVWHNEKDGTFTEWTGTHGFLNLKKPSRCSAPIDHDRDGDVDLMVGNYRLIGNQFYENNGDGTVSERAFALGLAGEFVSGAYGHTIGLAWGDIDNDGDFDQVSANLAHPRFFDFSDKTQVLINDGKGKYSPLTDEWTSPSSSKAGLRYQETHSVPLLADFDNSGTLDLVITCVYDGRPTDFYWGKGDGTFDLDAYHAGITTENGWGVSASDYDNDGDVDLFASKLFENTATGLGHFLQVKVRGTTANREALGATIELSVGATKRIRHVQGGSGKGGQDSRYVHFGLGTETSVDQIRVVFPGGAETVYPGPIAVDQRVWLVQDDATVRSGWAPPP